MPLYQKITYSWQIADSSTLAEIHAKRAETLEDDANLVESSGQYHAIADGGDTAINLGGVGTIKTLYVKAVDKDITVVVATQRIPLSAGGVLILSKTSLSALAIGNLSGAAANVFLSFAG